MKLRSAAAVAIFLVLTRFAFAQETRPKEWVLDQVAKLAQGSEKDRLAALFFLEDSRSDDVMAWRALLADRDDPRFLGCVVRGLGRVGEPELKPLLVEVLDKHDGPWTPDLARGAGLAVGLFGDVDLLPKLLAKATPREFSFAVGLMKKLPRDPTKPYDDWKVDRDLSPDTVEPALRWGALLEAPALAELARLMLTLEKPTATMTGTWRRDAAVDYFARSKAKAPASLRPALTELLGAQDPELAGLAARALAKSEGAGEAEAAAIEAAFVGAANRVTKVDEVRALSALQIPRAFDALVHMLDLSKSDPAVRRTVLETLKAVAAKLPDETRKTIAATIRTIIQPDEGTAPFPPDVTAAAVTLLAAVDPAEFLALMPALRLSASWEVRAAVPAALVGQKTSEQEWVSRFLEDPDRRVRIATYEALADDPAKVKWLVFFHAIHHTHVAVRDRSPGVATEMSLRTSDPVELASIAKFFATFPKDSIPRSFLEDAASLIPDHEVEALQSVLDLAGKQNRESCNQLLKDYLKSPEISLRKRAKDLLKKNGIEAVEEALVSERLLDSAIARANRVFEHPNPTAVIETNRGNITIQLFAGDAPATVENFLKLAKSGFYDGILWHRVVPAFVAQAGCPRGDGWGGPGYTIRCEVNDRTYRRGSIGMALAGKDTGGCQFFICHRALPHLDGRYTLFGRVTAGMDVVDRLGQEDYIIRIREL